MADTDVDVGILFQRKELEDLISALETSKFIANMMAFPTNQRGELNAALEDWKNFEQSEKINEHLKVLKEMGDEILLCAIQQGWNGNDPKGSE